MIYYRPSPYQRFNLHLYSTTEKISLSIGSYPNTSYPKRVICRRSPHRINQTIHYSTNSWRTDYLQLSPTIQIILLKTINLYNTLILLIKVIVHLGYSYHDLVLYPAFTGSSTNSLVGISKVCHNCHITYLTWIRHSLIKSAVYCGSDKTVYLDAIMSARPPHGLAFASEILPHGQNPLPVHQSILRSRLPQSSDWVELSALWN